MSRSPRVTFAALVAAAASCSPSTPAGPTARTCAIAQVSPPDWRLRADGTHLRDGLGRVVVLRGVNAGGRSKFAPYMPFDFAAPEFDARLGAYLDRAQSWGIDALRVPFTWAAVEPVQGADDETFLKRYDALVDGAWARGLWVIVDFHQDLYAEAFCGDGFPAWTIPGTPPAGHHDCATWGLEYFKNPQVQAAFDRLWADGSPVQAALVSMWDRMVARYKDRPGIAGFEVINEPSSGSAEAGPFEATTLTDFYAKMVARIRAAAPGALVFVDPAGTDGAFLTMTLKRPAGDGIVFAPHFYPLGAPNPASVTERMQVWADVGASWNVPVFVGEFGLSHGNSSAYAYMTGHFDALDALAMSGTEWEYSVAQEDWNLETYGLVAADGTEYPVARAVQRPFARAVAGDAIRTAFDADARVFTLDFAPSSSGVTEVSLPVRAYPKGFDVSLSGACVDTSHPGEVLLQGDPGAKAISLRVTTR